MTLAYAALLWAVGYMAVLIGCYVAVCANDLWSTAFARHRSVMQAIGTGLIITGIINIGAAFIL